MSKAVDAKALVKRFIGDAVCSLAVIALCLALGLPRYRNNIGLGDEGFLAYGAVRVLEGQLPNRDFVSLQPPLSFYTLAAMFKLFGTSLVTMRALGLCIYMLIALLVYALSRHLTGRLMALAAAVLAAVLGMPYFDFVPFAVWHGVVFTLAAALFFIRAVISGRRRLAFAAGVATALVIISRHDQGFYLVVAVLAYTLALKFARPNVNKPNVGRLLGFWGGGVAALMLPLGLYWLICGAAGYMFQHLVLFPLTTYAKTSSFPMPVFGLDAPLHYNAVVALFYLPPVIGAAVALWLLACFVRRRFYVKQARILFILVLSLLFYCQVLTRSDIHHLLITLAPFFVLQMWCLTAVSQAVGNMVGRICSRRRYGQWPSLAGRAVVLSVAGVIGLWFLLHTKTLFLMSVKQPAKTILLDRAGLRVEERYAYALENVTALIQSYAGPDCSILCLPYEPMFYFLSERRNPTRWNYLWPGDQTVDDHRALIEQARRDPPAVIVITGGTNMHLFESVILDYVDAEYKLAHDLGGLKLYVPLNLKE